MLRLPIARQRGARRVSSGLVGDSRFGRRAEKDRSSNSPISSAAASLIDERVACSYALRSVNIPVSAGSG